MKKEKAEKIAQHLNNQLLPRRQAIRIDTKVKFLIFRLDFFQVKKDDFRPFFILFPLNSRTGNIILVELSEFQESYALQRL
jgi:hypothetical protein